MMVWGAPGVPPTKLVCLGTPLAVPSAAAVAASSVARHAINATPARRRGGGGSATEPRPRSRERGLVKNCRVPATHWLISTGESAVPDPVVTLDDGTVATLSSTKNARSVPGRPGPGTRPADGERSAARHRKCQHGCDPPGKAPRGLHEEDAQGRPRQTAIIGSFNDQRRGARRFT